MSVGNALREGLSLVAAQQRDTFVLCIKLLLVCGVVSALIVMAQNSMMTAFQRMRADRAYAQFVFSWRRMFDALLRGRLRRAAHYASEAFLSWFYWKSLTPIGLIDTTLIGSVTSVSVAFLGADLLEAAIHVFELLI
ncbi:MAG TPA: hypothetical protein VF215_13595 [Thermoanaerobaculia bacterium]